MKTKSRISVPLLAALALAVAVVASAGSPADTVKPNFSRPIPNIPGKSLVAVEVLSPPGGVSLPHRHAKSTFIYAYVVSGQVGDGPERAYRAGESFYETPGAHHLVSRDASETEPAKLLAVFIVDTDDKPLTTPDK